MRASLSVRKDGWLRASLSVKKDSWLRASLSVKKDGWLRASLSVKTDDWLRASLSVRKDGWLRTSLSNDDDDDVDDGTRTGRRPTCLSEDHLWRITYYMYNHVSKRLSARTHYKHKIKPTTDFKCFVDV